LFDAVESKDDLGQNAVNLLSAILRTRPETAFPAWMRFRDLLLNYAASSNAKDKLFSLGLLQALMLGRRDFGREMGDEPMNKSVVDLALLVLDKIGADENAQCQCLRLNIYGAVLTMDWAKIGGNPNDLLGPFHGIVAHCRDPKAKVRSAACKAIGDFCTQYISLETYSATDDVEALTSQFKMISDTMLDTMLQPLDEKPDSVRCVVRVTNES
jgi:hypothetical protein